MDKKDEGSIRLVTYVPLFIGERVADDAKKIGQTESSFLRMWLLEKYSTKEITNG